MYQFMNEISRSLIYQGVETSVTFPHIIVFKREIFKLSDLSTMFPFFSFLPLYCLS